MNVLYLSYTGLLEALGQSQVLAYVRGLSADYGHRFQIISYEKPQHWADQTLMQAQHSQLAAQAIGWHPLRYHQRPTAPATLYDVLRGLPRAVRLVQRHQIQIVHVRSYVPMLIGIALKKLLGVQLIFDMRGLWADERADVGACTRESRQYRTIKALERASLRAADHVVMLTQRVKHELQQQTPLQEQPRPISVIPCCVDTQRFKPNETTRNTIRAKHQWQDKTVLVSSGSLGGWYFTTEMAHLFALWQQHDPTLHLLVLTNSQPSLITEPLSRFGIAPETYTVQAASSAEVPSWLNAADGALMLIQPWYSKIASSPTKQAEYLACGLPIVANAGVGDSDEIISKHHVGVLFRGWDASTLHDTYHEFRTLLDDSTTAARCRHLAETTFDLNHGVVQYHHIYQSLGAASE